MQNFSIAQSGESEKYGIIYLFSQKSIIFQQLNPRLFCLLDALALPVCDPFLFQPCSLFIAAPLRFASFYLRACLTPLRLRLQPLRSGTPIYCQPVRSFLSITADSPVPPFCLPAPAPPFPPPIYETKKLWYNKPYRSTERSEIVDQSEHLRSEKRILRISFIGSLFFLLAECAAVFFTRSQAVLIDCIYDLADLVMLLPFMILVPKLYKPVTEKWPYGLSQIEPLFVIIRCGVLLLLDIQLMIDSVQMILDGGHLVNAATVASFEFAMAVSCILVYILLGRLCKKVMSPTMESELYVWKVDAYSTAGVGLAFLVQIILQSTPLSWITPYIDPGIAVVMAIILLPEPLGMVHDSVKSLILAAPEPELTEHIRKIATDALSQYGIQITFLDIIKTGRRIWADIYITQEDDLLRISALKAAQEKIRNALSNEYENISIELIPELTEES